MKLLLDECIDHHLRAALLPHDVYTVTFLGWSGTKNGELLRRAAENGFDAMVTTDRSIRYQQNAVTLPLTVIRLAAKSNDYDDVVPFVPKLPIALEQLPRRTFIDILSF